MSDVPDETLRRASRSSSGYVSSPDTSPPNTLKRSRSSSFRLLNRRCSSISNVSVEPERYLFGWYVSFLFRIAYELTTLSLYVAFRRLPFVLPTLWFSACLWTFRKCVGLPLSMVKTTLLVLFVPKAERNRKKRTVLISGGASIETVHLARNFYTAGARVVVCEVGGRFGLARFSTAVHSYYTVPEPGEDNGYIEALKAIVSRERVTYYVPVSKSNSAYYDALAKPHLETLGCECICPDVKEVLFLDDALELMKRVQNDGMATPNFFLVQTMSDLNRLYDLGVLKCDEHFMVSVGMSGCKQKRTIKLPKTRRRLRLRHPISEQNPWLVVQDYAGQHYTTCTTVKESQVVANVTCKMDATGDGLTPVDRPEIELWLRQFFASMKFNRKITGHFNFSFAEATESGSTVPLGCQVGIRLPYICYTSVHPRIVWQPCRHFSRHKSGPIVTERGRYWIHDLLLRTIVKPSFGKVLHLLNTVFGRNEVLFTIWDPLPYCAYYYMQLPLMKLQEAFDRILNP